MALYYHEFSKISTNFKIMTEFCHFNRCIYNNKGVLANGHPLVNTYKQKVIKMQEKIEFKVKEIYKNKSEENIKVALQKILNNVIKKYLQY